MVIHFINSLIVGGLGAMYLNYSFDKSISKISKKMIMILGSLLLMTLSALGIVNLVE